MDLSKDGSIANLVVVGIGGVGGYYGAKIADKIARRSDQNRKVSFIARGPHLKAIKEKGIVFNSAGKERIVAHPQLATDKIEEIKDPDLCLICVKGYDLDKVMERLKKTIRDDTIIIPLLNGVDIYERIREQTSKGIVLPACVYVSASIEQPGVVTQQGMDGVILCGNDPRYPDFDPQRVMNLFEQMELTFRWNNDPFPAIWEKYLFIASFALVTAYAEKTFGGVMEDQELKGFVQKIMEEIISIAEKKNVKLPDNIIINSLEKAHNFPYETKTSYQRDVEKAKNQNEGDLFGGTIIRLGRKMGVPTPITQSLYSEITGGHLG